MSAHNPYTFHEGGFHRRPQARGGRRRGQGGRGYYRPYEEVIRHEAWHENNLFNDFVEDPNTLPPTERPTPTVACRLLPVELLKDTNLLPTVGHLTVAIFNQWFNGYFQSFNHKLARTRI
ncbi:hypothetical protein M9H77_31482 [Catharanthus roseus]|uniref:Uncharacterized protein n=1 Tax=Catharanthus roseus TaxID=4058 RepID=A0ACC0A073_CATRO|nr:hypothetical protein M9H77_31482 [Catharanthus roseus]